MKSILSIRKVSDAEYEVLFREGAGPVVVTQIMNTGELQHFTWAEIIEALNTDPGILDRPMVDNEARMEALETFLASTDWYVIRQQETGRPVPEDILAQRESARAEISELRGGT